MNEGVFRLRNGAGLSIILRSLSGNPGFRVVAYLSLWFDSVVFLIELRCEQAVSGDVDSQRRALTFKECP